MHTCRSRSLCFYVFATIMLSAIGSWTSLANAQATYSALHDFTDGTVTRDGKEPYGGLVLGPDSNLYGTAVDGGTANDGVIFRLTQNGVYTVIHNFHDGSVLNDGKFPEASMVVGTDGNLYGTTFGGGSAAEGTVFKITLSGTETVLHSFGDFTVANDAISSYGLIQATDGNFYGTSQFGGSMDKGAFYKMTPEGVITILHSFADGSVTNDGSEPECSVVEGASGVFYGTTSTGGASSGTGSGTVFKITNSGTETILHSFQDGTVANDGSTPEGALCFGGDGNLYGDTYQGGYTGYYVNGAGSAFKISTTGTYTVLHDFTQFTGTSDGVFPLSGLTYASDGNFYGTTQQGGGSGGGTIFRMSSSGSVTILHSFTQTSFQPDGQEPTAGLVEATPGNFYGAATYGALGVSPSSLGDGVVFNYCAAGAVVPIPVIAPNGGSYTAVQNVTLTDTLTYDVPGTQIYYTLDGTTPTSSSTLYAGPFILGQSAAVKAVAVESTNFTSAVATANFTITLTVPTPTFSPVSGPYTTSQNVAISDSKSGVSIYYTTDGSTPTTSSTLYDSSVPVVVSSNETLKAIGTLANYTNSAVASGSYIIGATVPTPTITPGAATYSATQSVVLADGLDGSTIYYTTDGTVPTTGSTAYVSGTPLTVTGPETVTAIAVANGYFNSADAVAMFSFLTDSPSITPPGGTFIDSGFVTITDPDSRAKIYYTIDGTTPTTSSAQYLSPIQVQSTSTITAIAETPTYQPSSFVGARFIVIPPTAEPQISPNGGSFTSTQTVTITDQQIGAVIYYTLDGTVPTTSSPQYTVPIEVSSSQIVTANAVAPNYGPSDAVSDTYVINRQLPPPTILPGGGTFTAAQNVTLTDSVSSAVIYYSTNSASSSPTWQQYVNPFPLYQSDTVAAYATAASYTNSSTTTDSFTINTAFSSGLQLISLPASYPGIGLDTIFGYSGVKLAVWDPAGDNYAITPTPPANSIVAGQGYWVRFPQAVTVTLSGTPIPTNTPYVINLLQGWNMIGDPFTSPVALSALSFDNGMLSYSSAAGAFTPLIGTSVFSYNIGSNAYETVTSLSPGVGCWIFAYTATDMDVPAPVGP